MERTFPIDVETSFRAEVLCKDLVSWLEIPTGASGWGSASFTTIEQWELWWKDVGPAYVQRAIQSFTELAEARVEAGLEPQGD